MNLKKLIIFPVIFFLILFTIGFILTDGMKYSGLTETQTERIKMVEDKCATADPSKMEQCYLFAEMATERLKKDNLNP